MTEPGEDLWACLMLPSKYLRLKLLAWLRARAVRTDDAQILEETT